MKHLNSEQLSARLDGALSGSEAEAAERHLTECQECRDALADLAAQDVELRPLLAHDPGEAYFDELPSRIAARILTQEMKEPKAEFNFSRLFQSPRSLAWVGTAAVLIVGGGIVLMNAGQVQSPDLRDRDVVTRSERGQEQAAAPKIEPDAEAMQGAPVKSVPLEGTRAREDKSAAGTVAPTRKALPADQRRAAAQGGFAQPPPSARPAAPSPPAFRSTTPSKDADSPATGAGASAKRQSAPASTNAHKTAAQSSRANEVSFNQAGEPVPAPTRTNPPPPSQTAAKAKEEQVRKQTAAAPLEETPHRDESAKLGAPAPQPILKPIAPAAPPATKSAPATGAADAVAPHDNRLCGVVLDPEGRPVAGASVEIPLLRIGTTTDLRGGFCLDAAGEQRVTVMAVGFGSNTQTLRAGETATVTLSTVPVLNKPLALAPSAPSTTTPAPVASKGDPYVALPESQRSVVRAAQQAQASADAQSNPKTAAKLYDDAASGYQKALKVLMGQPLELETRWHLAETRYRAWEKDPNNRRETAAVDALTAFAGRAPGGSQRDQATRMLDHIKR